MHVVINLYYMRTHSFSRYFNTRTRQVLGYGVKSWLVPQLAFLKSMGAAEADLPALIMARPQVLGSNILRVRRRRRERRRL